MVAHRFIVVEEEVGLQADIDVLCANPSSVVRRSKTRNQKNASITVVAGMSQHDVLAGCDALAAQATRLPDGPLFFIDAKSRVIQVLTRQDAQEHIERITTIISRVTSVA